MQGLNDDGRAERGHSCPQQLANVSLARISGWFCANHVAADKNVRAPQALAMLELVVETRRAGSFDPALCMKFLSEATV